MNRRNDRVPQRSQAPGRRAPGAVTKDTFCDDPMYSSIVRVVAAILAGGNVVRPVDVLVFGGGGQARGKRSAKADALYTNDASAAWAWSRALLAFRKHGDDEQAKAALAEAKQTNPHVPVYLTGKKKMPRRLPDMIGFGDESEAISYVGDYGSAWRNTPNAIAWAASR